LSSKFLIFSSNLSNSKESFTKASSINIILFTNSFKRFNFFSNSKLSNISFILLYLSVSINIVSTISNGIVGTFNPFMKIKAISKLFGVVSIRESICNLLISFKNFFFSSNLCFSSSIFFF